MQSLRSIRTRVERLAADWSPPPQTIVIYHELSDERCPACDYDLKAHARAAAWAEAIKGRDPRDGPPAFVFYATDELTTCPRCGAPLPS